jgi:hypothetical protein
MSPNEVGLDENFEYRFHFIPNSDHPVVFRATWDQFRPTFRGRERDDAPKLDPSRIYSMSIMCSSYFNAQKGWFELMIDYIAAF